MDRRSSIFNPCLICCQDLATFSNFQKWRMSTLTSVVSSDQSNYQFSWQLWTSSIFHDLVDTIKPRFKLINSFSLLCYIVFQYRYIMSNPGEPATEGASAASNPKASKTLLTFEVNVNDIDTNLDELATKVLAIKMDGLAWKQAPQKVPVAYGMFKLIFSCLIEDDKVLTDDMFGEIQKNEQVQSADVMMIQKL